MATYFPPSFTTIKPKKKTASPSASWPSLPSGDYGFAPSTPTGGPPTLADILAADPTYAALSAALGAASVSDRASLTAARQRALINYGTIPNFPDYSGVGDIGSDITPQIRALADQATAAGLSTTARLSAADKTAQADIANSLGARGMFRSGATGNLLSREQLAYTQQTYDSMQKLTDYLAGAQAAFVAAENARKQQELAAQQAAAANAAANPPVGYGFGPGFGSLPGVPSPPPALDPGALFGGGFQAPATPPKTAAKPAAKKKAKKATIAPYAGLH